MSLCSVCSLGEHGLPQREKTSMKAAEVKGTQHIEEGMFYIRLHTESRGLGNELSENTVKRREESWTICKINTVVLTAAMKSDNMLRIELT